MFLLKKKGCTVILLIFFYLQLISFITPIRAQEQPPILEINSSFILTEYANDIGQNSNDSSVNIDIPLSQGFPPAGLKRPVRAFSGIILIQYVPGQK